MPRRSRLEPDPARAVAYLRRPGLSPDAQRAATAQWARS